VIARRLALSVLALGAAISTNAGARPEHAGGSVVIGAQGLLFEEAPDGSADGLAALGLDLRGAVAPGSAPIGLAGGAGYHFGASHPGGFVYQLALLPLGVATFVDGIGWLAVMGGGDLCGVTARVPFAPRAIAEARLELELPGPFHLAAYFQPAWLAVDERRDGARDFELADEIEIGAGIRIGREGEPFGIDASRGLFVGGLFRQWLGATGYGLVVGYTVDGQVR
jgi:hypothetical protein